MWCQMCESLIANFEVHKMTKDREDDRPGAVSRTREVLFSQRRQPLKKTMSRGRISKLNLDPLSASCSLRPPGLNSYDNSRDDDLHFTDTFEPGPSQG